jgi:signal peptidase II
VRRGPAVTAAIAAAVVAVDQAAKFAVRGAVPADGRSVPVLGDLVRLTLVQNEGAAFGLLPGGRIAFVVVSILALCAIAIFLVRRRPQHPWLVVALGLVAGGAAGNLIDRAMTGKVIDFIQIPFDFPVFNVADSSIVVGVAMLLWWLLFGPSPAEASAAQTTDGEAAADGQCGEL